MLDYSKVFYSGGLVQNEHYAFEESLIDSRRVQYLQTK